MHEPINTEPGYLMLWISAPVKLFIVYMARLSHGDLNNAFAGRTRYRMKGQGLDVSDFEICLFCF